jgi:hypothetical protein
VDKVQISRPAIVRSAMVTFSMDDIQPRPSLHISQLLMVFGTLSDQYIRGYDYIQYKLCFCIPLLDIAVQGACTDGQDCRDCFERGWNLFHGC